MLGHRQGHLHPVDRQPRGDQEEIHRLAREEDKVGFENTYVYVITHFLLFLACFYAFPPYFSWFLRIFSYFRIHEEFKALKLSDLRIIATLGVGGFGRVELVSYLETSPQSFLGVVSYLENSLPGNDCRGLEDPQLCLEADEEESDCGDQATATHHVR